MGTRALVKFVNTETEEPFVTIYKQFDGYPDGLGQDILDCFKDRELVNGIPFGSGRKYTNGIHDAAALLVAYLKGSQWNAGDVYVYGPDAYDMDEEFVYTVSGGALNVTDPLTLKVYAVWSDKTLYDGPLNDFDPEAYEDKE